MEVAVLGATGYAGCELVRLLCRHPGVEIAFVSSESHAGSSLDLVHPQFYNLFELELQPLRLSAIPESVELVFAPCRTVVLPGWFPGFWRQVSGLLI